MFCVFFFLVLFSPSLSFSIPCLLKRFGRLVCVQRSEEGKGNFPATTTFLISNGKGRGLKRKKFYNFLSAFCIQSSKKERTFQHFFFSRTRLKESSLFVIALDDGGRKAVDGGWPEKKNE